MTTPDTAEFVAPDGAESGDVMGTRCQVSSYTVSAVPESENAYGGSAWAITVDYVGEGRWAVRWLSRCLSRERKWVYEHIPSERTEDWLADHRFTLDEALAVAQEMAPTIVVNGMTPADVIAHAKSWGRLHNDTAPTPADGEQSDREQSR